MVEVDVPLSAKEPRKIELASSTLLDLLYYRTNL
jgi:hypothetical protein